MFEKLKEFFKEKDHEYEYLSNSHSLEDLERRQREISRGEASFMKLGNLKAKGYFS